MSANSAPTSAERRRRTPLPLGMRVGPSLPPSGSCEFGPEAEPRRKGCPWRICSSRQVLTSRQYRHGAEATRRCRAQRSPPSSPHHTIRVNVKRPNCPGDLAWSSSVISPTAAACTARSCCRMAAHPTPVPSNGCRRRRTTRSVGSCLGGGHGRGQRCDDHAPQPRLPGDC